MAFLKLRTWYKFHKWLSILTGLALIMWLITAVTMNPGRFFSDEVATVEATPGYHTAVLPPSDVLLMLETIIGKKLSVSSLTLNRIIDLVVYQIRLEEGPLYTLNAQSGEIVEITPELAEQIAHFNGPSGAKIILSERLARNSISYPYGVVPVYRYIFDDPQSTHVHVVIENGMAFQNTRWTRVGDILGAVHTFDALRLFTDRRRLIIGLILASAAATMIAALIGYYIALPHRRRSQT